MSYETINIIWLIGAVLVFITPLFSKKAAKELIELLEHNAIGAIIIWFTCASLWPLFLIGGVFLLVLIGLFSMVERRAGK